jgi:hypothetical protein
LNSFLMTLVTHFFLAVCSSVSMCLSILGEFFCYWGLVLFCCDLICRGYFDFLEFVDTCFVS